jgi:hypothetical protein
MMRGASEQLMDQRLSRARRASVSASLVSTLLVALVAPATGRAWGPVVHEQVAEQAARLMPASLQSVLGQHLAQLKAGSTAPLSVPGASLAAASGQRDAAIMESCQRVLDLLAKQGPMPAVAYELGLLSHHVAAADNPLNVSDEDVRETEWAGDFERFTEQRLPRFRVVFNGYLSPTLEKDDVRGFVRECSDRTRRLYPVLTSSYVQPDGRIAASAGWDDRHPVFGVASLSYQHAIGDTARLWLYLWIRSGGDAGNLPFPQALDGFTEPAEPAP